MTGVESLRERLAACDRIIALAAAHGDRVPAIAARRRKLAAELAAAEEAATEEAATHLVAPTAPPAAPTAAPAAVLAPPRRAGRWFPVDTVLADVAARTEPAYLTAVLPVQLRRGGAS